MKVVLYGIAVVCFIIAGALDLTIGRCREGFAAILLGVVNGLIFLWR